MTNASNKAENYEKELLQNLKTLESNIAEIKSILSTMCGTLVRTKIQGQKNICRHIHLLDKPDLDNIQ